MDVHLGHGAAHMARLTAALLAIVAAVTFAIVLAEWPFVERAIALEDAPIAWLQSTLLAASAVACLCQGVLHSSRRVAWYVVAGALFALALDERFMGHERLKEWIWLEIFDGESDRAGRWPDLPMVLYPVTGAAVVTWIVREVRSRYPARLIWGAIAVGSVAVVLDVASQSISLQIWEELLELLAEALFFIGLLVSLRATSGPSTPPQPVARCSSSLPAAPGASTAR